MLDWPFLILSHDIDLNISNIAHYLLHPLFLLVTIGLGFCTLERKIWGRLSFFVTTVFLLSLYVDSQWPIIKLPEDHLFANIPKPTLPLAIVIAYLGWLAWEYRQNTLRYLSLGFIGLYMYNLHQIYPLEWQPGVVTILIVLIVGAFYEIIARIAKNYPQIIGLLISIGTIPLIMNVSSPPLIMYALQGFLAAFSIGWILSGAEQAQGKGFQWSTVLTVFTFVLGGILLWIVFGIFDHHKNTPIFAIAIGTSIALWITSGVNQIIQFYTKK